MFTLSGMIAWLELMESRTATTNRMQSYHLIYSRNALYKYSLTDDSLTNLTESIPEAETVFLPQLHLGHGKLVKLVFNLCVSTF